MPKLVRPLAARYLSLGVTLAVFAGCSAGRIDRVVPNDNRVAAGVMRDGVLTLHLEARNATWYPDANDGPGLMVPVFAEVGRAPQNPGPLIRVPAGTTIQLSVRNSIPGSALVLFGVHTRPSAVDDTIQIASGATRQLSFLAGAPGTYFYWGTTTHQGLDDRGGVDSQLQGGFVVDRPGVAAQADRIFVLGSWYVPPSLPWVPRVLLTAFLLLGLYFVRRVIKARSAPRTIAVGRIKRVAIIVGGTLGVLVTVLAGDFAMVQYLRPAGTDPELRVINGLSWPHTERISYAVGDTVRWRWVNPSDSPHPMHLHGFYFDVTSRGTWAADTVFEAADRPHVVTEMPLTGQTFAMTWVPNEPGNWLVHCHVAFHTSLFISPGPVADPEDPVALDPMIWTGMRGMVLGVSVTPGASTVRRPEFVEGARAIRLVAQTARNRWHGRLDEMAFVRQEGAVVPAADSVPTPSSLLVLQRGQPVRVTVVNHTRAPTAVHWHGIELPSYPDGVPGWSGLGSRTAPMIAPGDSFVAAFTPTRSGTFIYHAHSNEYFQINLGLYGALLVVDSARYDPIHERIIILGGDGPGGRPGRINGRLKPDTMRLTLGETYRIRLIDIMPDWTIRVAMMREDSTVHWKALAKDGAELPPRAQVMQPAAFITGPGQTMDFEYRPTAPGVLLFQVRHRVDNWKTHLPIVVE
jgi:FtsP/CotA-like multicopper oxidase with cupredoxin domain